MNTIVEIKDQALGGRIYRHKMLNVPRVGEFITGVLIGGTFDHMYEVVMVIHNSINSAFVVVKYSDVDFARVSGQITW